MGGREVKTVKDLIAFLGTVDPALPVGMVYDGMESALFVFQMEGKLFFSHSDYEPESYKDADVGFATDLEDGIT